MDLNDAVQRVLRRHLVLIAAVAALGLLVPLLTHLRADPTYRASARMAITSPDPRNAEESVALADAGQAIVTSPGRVAVVLSKVGARRDPDDFAANNVRVRPVGSSGVVELSVTDRDRRVASKVANALADELLQVRREVSNGQTARLLFNLDNEISAATQRIAELRTAQGAASTAADARLAQANILKLQHDEAIKKRSDIQAQRQALLQLQARGTGSAFLPQLLATLTAQIDAANQQIAEIETASKAVADPAASPSDALRLQYDEAVQARNDLESQRDRLAAAQASQPATAVIDGARPPRHPEPSGLVPDVILGGLLGLLVGLSIAAVLEVLWPNVVGSDALARLLQAPVLGRLRRRPDQFSTREDPDLPAHVALAAAGAQVSNVLMVGVDGGVSLDRLVNWLRSKLSPGLDVGPLSGAVAWSQLEASPSTYRRPGPEEHDDGPRRAGLVIVAPSTSRRRDLDRVTLLTSLTRLPLLGVVTYHGRGRGKAPRATIDVRARTDHREQEAEAPSRVFAP